MKIKKLLLVLLSLLILSGCSMPPAQLTNSQADIEKLSTPIPIVIETPPPVTTEPTPQPTPVPTPDPTPEPTPDPTPAPKQAPTITKQPTDETVNVGETAYFVASADGAEEISWYIAGPDGSTGYSAQEIGNYLPAVSCSGYNTGTLTINNVTADMDGWKAVCRFTNAVGKTYSAAAVIHVQLTVDDRIVSIMNYLIDYAHPRMAAVNVGLPYVVAHVADSFVEYDISAYDIRRVVSEHLKALSEEEKEKYIRSALTVKNAFPWISSNPDCFKQEDEGYGITEYTFTPKYYPWSQRDLTDCFEALIVD